MEIVDNYKNDFEGKVLSPIDIFFFLAYFLFVLEILEKTGRQSRDNLIKSLSLL